MFCVSFLSRSCTGVLSTRILHRMTLAIETDAFFSIDMLTLLCTCYNPHSSPCLWLFKSILLRGQKLSTLSWRLPVTTRSDLYGLSVMCVKNDFSNRSNNCVSGVENSAGCQWAGAARSVVLVTLKGPLR